MNQSTSSLSKGGQIISLVILVALILTEISHAEDLAFFEKKYNRKITGVKSKGDYSDPDKYYRAIADKLGIPQIALDAVSRKFGWETGTVKDDRENGVWRHGNTIQYMMVKRRPGQWQCMVVQVSINPETNKPITDPEIRWVFVDDEETVHFPEVPEENGRAEQDAAEQPAAAGESK